MTEGYIKGEHRDPKFGAEEIEHRFGFHKATIEGENATLPKHRAVRLLFREFAEKLDDLIPTSREKSVAFTELENASMWVHKAIAMDAPLMEEESEFDFNEIAMPEQVKGIFDNEGPLKHHLKED